MYLPRSPGLSTYGSGRRLPSPQTTAKQGAIDLGGHTQRLTKRTRHRFQRFIAAVAGAVMLIVLAPPAAQAYADPYDTPLTLLNGWTGAPFGTQVPGVKQLNDGIVTFTGAIAGGTNGVAFTVPANDRPASNVFLTVDMYNSTKGRLEITPNGVGTVTSEFAFANATSFTSLDGVSYALPSAAQNTPLTPQGGWQAAPYGNAAPGVQLETYVWPFSGLTQVSVHFTGAISTKSSNPGIPFTLPPSMRPSTTRYVPVDMCNATNGRLIIRPDGTVNPQGESDPAESDCFTSLDGAWFTLDPGLQSTPLTLLNGWVPAGNGTGTPTVDVVGASTIVLSGAMKSTGSSEAAFVLPSSMAPHTAVYVPIDVAEGGYGRLYIHPDGVVEIQSEGEFSLQAYLTSLDGASFSTWLNPAS